MKIVILDGFTVNPGDLDWKAIESLGQCEVYDRTEPEKIFERSKDADILITSKVVFDREMINRLNKLKYIGVIATGYNVVDIKAAREKNIIVTNIPNYCTESVAQMVFAHIFEFARNVGHHSNIVKQGKWSEQKDFCFWDFSQIELSEKILGVVGCGNIGRSVCRIALGFGMKILAYDKYPSKIEGVEFTDLDRIFKQSDIITLHCPLTDETREIINYGNILKMKKNCFIVNTGRGPLVNEEDLSRALNEGIIAGAGLDVLQIEPPVIENPLFSSKNVFITPHIAWSGFESRKKLIGFTADNIKAFLDGKPINVVN